MEEWRAVAGFPTYQVSDDGRVQRIGKGRGSVDGRILRPWRGGRTKQYRQVSLSRDGVVIKIFVHRLVATAFHGDSPSPTHQVNHIDGDKANNRAENLEWATPSENQQHAYRTGLLLTPTPPRGSAHYNAKLTADDVREIRARAGGETQLEMARRFGVGKGTVWNIIHRLSWEWLA